MTEAELQAIARQKASEHGIDPALVCAVCEQESAWHPWAVRLEQGFFVRYVPQAIKENDPLEAVCRAASWGLMQVMGQVAREFGLDEPIPDMARNPAVGIEMGCRKLARSIEKHNGDLHTVLQEYNGGGNPHYADEVMTRISKYG